MATLDHLNPFTSIGIGFALALRPKNLLLSFAVGVEIGSAQLGIPQSLIVIGIFTVLGVSTVASPIIASLILGAKMERTLNTTREWIVRNNYTLTSVALIMSGVVILDAGISRF